MGVRAWLSAVGLTLMAHGVSAEVLLRQVAWPQARECTTCIPLQYSRLDMPLPRAEIGKVLVVDTGHAVHLLPPSGDIKSSMTLQAVTQETVLARYAQKGDFLRRYNISTARDLYEVLGMPAKGDEMLAAVKAAEMTASAVAYTRASKNGVHVYRIQCADPQSQRIYFVIDGDETHYMLDGPVSQALYEAILASLRIANVP